MEVLAKAEVRGRLVVPAAWSTHCMCERKKCVDKTSPKISSPLTTLYGWVQSLPRHLSYIEQRRERALLPPLGLQVCILSPISIQLLDIANYG